MKRFVAGTFALVVASLSVAQTSEIIGKYSGNYSGARGSTNTVVLDVQNATDGKVTGTLERQTASRRGGSCSGAYPFAGTFKDNQLDVRSTEKGGAAGDCSVRLTATLKNNKLVGKLGQTEVELSK